MIADEAHSSQTGSSANKLKAILGSDYPDGEEVSTEEYVLKPGTDIGTGNPHDAEKKQLSEIIDALNDLFGAEISDDDQLHFANGVAARISRDEEVMAQVNGHGDPG